MIEPGYYNARATAAAYGHTSKGTDQIAVDFVITSSANPQYQGAHITWYGFLTKDTATRTLEALIACGCTDLNTLEGLSANEVQLDVRHEPNLQGEMRARVAFVNKLGGIAMKSRMSNEEARSVTSRWQGKFAALRARGASSSPNARPASKGTPHDPPASTSPEDDNIPF